MQQALNELRDRKDTGKFMVLASSWFQCDSDREIRSAGVLRGGAIFSIITPERDRFIWKRSFQLQRES
ncbi:MAG: hypothetical protein K2X43_23115, partial [Hyphomonadaceae bacterium]|nr:hypothetical protein [Hyphomonadaceae bacterium]